jgi:hypothetical protein
MCWKKDRLYKITCLGSHDKEGKMKSREKKTPSLTVPPNLPNQVVITPGMTPYPEDDQQEAGATDNPSDIPSQDIGTPTYTPEPSRQPEIGSVTPLPHHQPEIGPTTPLQGTTPCNAVGHSSPTQNKNFTNGCGKGNDSWISCRAGIGTGPNGNTTPESGNQKIPVSTLIKNSQHYYAIYHFSTQKQTSGGPVGAEVTGGYCGSNDSVPQVGITIGINGKGQIIRRTEDHYKKGRNVAGDYNELTHDGTSGPGFVGHVPELSNLDHKDFYIIWCADKDGSTVTYRGYIRVGNKEYQIANLVNPTEGGGVSDGKHHDSRTKIIDFTEPGHNTYLRGRHNNLGSICPTGTLYPCRYQPPSM